MKHKHRINPGHNGGDYTEGNVISVEVVKCNGNTSSHAMWHYANWRLWGKLEDKIAWKALSGFWGQEKIIQETLRAGGMYAGKLPFWTNGEKEVRALESPGEGWHQGRSRQVRKKLSEARQGYKDTEEAKKNKSKASKGRRKSPSHREAMKKSARRGDNHPFYGKEGRDSPTYGTKRTPEQLEKMSGPNHHNFGKTLPESVKEKLRQSNSKKRHWVNKNGDHKFQENNPGEGWVNGRKWKG